MTFVMVLGLIFFGTLQCIKLVLFDETDIMVSQRDAHFGYDYSFSDGLAFAFAVTAYDDELESIEDPSIGTIRPFYKSWGLKGSGEVDFEPIPTRPCTPAELHING